MTTAYSNSQLQTWKITGRHDLSLEQRISLQIAISDKGCWLWQGGTTSANNGYGRIRVKGEKTLAHRASFELFVRPISKNLTLDHLCRNRLCVNPFHLVPKTQHHNILVGESRMSRLAIASTCARGHEFTFQFYTNNGKRSIRRYCTECPKTNSAEKQRNWYRSQRTKGLCVKCRRAAVHGIFCEVHHGV